MGFYVHLSVCYSSELEDDIKPELEKLVNKYKKEDAPKEAIWILEAILDPKNYNCGPKGFLFTWGVVGNYTSGQEVVDYLKPFFEEQLRNNLGTLDFDHILIFEEREQSQQAIAYEIFLEDSNSDEKGPLIVKRHELPFCWNQF